MAMFHLLKIRSSIDLFKNEKCKVTFGLKYIYTWKKVREHLLCYEGKLWTNIFLHSKQLFNLSKSVVFKVA